jgi:adenylate cyclase
MVQKTRSLVISGKSFNNKGQPGTGKSSYGLLFLAVIFFLQVTASPGARPPDSLTNQYLSHRNDTIRYSLLITFIRKNLESRQGRLPSPEVRSLTDRAIERLRSINDQRRLGLFLGLKAEICIAAKNWNAGDLYCDSSIRIAEKFRDYESLGLLYELKTVIYKNMNLNERMVQALYRSADNYKQAGNVGREAEMLFELGTVYANTDQADLALRTYLQSAQITNDKDETCKAYLFAAHLALKKNDLRLAEEYLRKGKAAKNNPNEELSYYFFFVNGKWLRQMNRGEEARASLETADSLATLCNQTGLRVMALCESADISLDEKKTGDAKKILDQAASLSGHVKSLDTKIEVSRVLARFYEESGQSAKALEEYKAWRMLKDSLHQSELSGALTRSVKETEYNKTETKRAEEQWKKDQAESRKLRRQKLIAYTSGAVLIFIGFIAFLLIRNNRRQKLANIIIAEEKERSDNLLSNILPDEVAEELKSTGTSKARDFNGVTVLFTDFRNFTKVSEQLTAQEIVNEIHFYYSAFDTIITKYGVEKIKTIGDSYMCAGGIPAEDEDNTENTVKAALEMRDFMEGEKQKRISAGLPYLEIRIGLHHGPVVAGIVGTKKFAYDIWGDTVNVASRMESSGEPGKVNISGETYKAISDRFDFLYRGKIAVKNRGMIDMYFVERLATAS